MKTTKFLSLAVPGTLLLAGWLSLAFTGCASPDQPASGDGVAGVDTTVEASAATKGAAQIWAENCSRCHNARSPSQYSDSQWEVIGMHMRVRGYLTGQEQRTIVEFLKAGN